MPNKSAWKYLNKLEGQRVLVLGGSTGVGYAVAEAALEHGASLIVSSSNQEKLDTALAKLQGHAEAIGKPLEHVKGKICDVANSATVEENIVQLLEFATTNGKLNHAIFTAGDIIDLPVLTETSMDEIHCVSMVRQFAPIFLAKHLPKYIVSGTASSLTLTGASTCWRPGPNWSILAGVGAAIEGLARGFAVDLKPIRVNVVRLGIVPTEFFDHIPQQQRESLIEIAAKETINGTPGKPEEVAEAYLFCLKGTFTTGAVVEANGGQLVGRSG